MMFVSKLKATKSVFCGTVSNAMCQVVAYALSILILS